MLAYFGILQSLDMNLWGRRISVEGPPGIVRVEQGSAHNPKWSILRLLVEWHQGRHAKELRVPLLFPQLAQQVIHHLAKVNTTESLQTRKSSLPAPNCRTHRGCSPLGQASLFDLTVCNMILLFVCLLVASSIIIGVLMSFFFKSS